MTGETLYGHIDRGTVNVTRWVTVYDVVDAAGRTDDENGTWRRRTPTEFALAIMQAADGLRDPWVDCPNSDTGAGVEVTGSRPATDEEKAEYDRRERLAWLAAKGTYERGLSKFGPRCDPQETA
jgi:hypothetical protein